MTDSIVRPFFKVRRFISSWWYNLRYINHQNPMQVVRPKKAHAEKLINKAIETVSGTDTPEFKAYLRAREDYGKKWYRFFIRKPVWISGGTVFLKPGVYTINKPIKMNPGVLIEGAGKDKTTVNYR